MTDRIEEGVLEPEELNLAATGDIDAHLRSLGELARVVNRAMSHMLAFELRIRFSISELETASQSVAVTDLHRTNQLLTASEVARKLGVSVWALRNNRGGKFPTPWEHRGKSLLFRRAEVDEWLRTKN
jgi:predicted DNA-binding transcriptional regulator AlpA